MLGEHKQTGAFPQLFRVLPNLYKCFYNSIETWRTCFLYVFVKIPLANKKTKLFTLILNLQIAYTIFTLTGCASSGFYYKSISVLSRMPFADLLHCSLFILL